jgi:hypothetical protein
VIAFDPAAKTYVQTGTSNAASFDVHFPGSVFKVEFNWAGQRYLFTGDLVHPLDGGSFLQLWTSSIFEPVKHYWIPFIGSDEIIDALRPFVAAHSSTEWRGRITGVIDGRPARGMSLDEALGRPSDTALDKLVQESQSRRLRKR